MKVVYVRKNRKSLMHVHAVVKRDITREHAPLKTSVKTLRIVQPHQDSAHPVTPAFNLYPQLALKVKGQAHLRTPAFNPYLQLALKVKANTPYD